MGNKKTATMGLTDQLRALQRMEVREIKKNGRKLVRLVDKQIEETCAHLEQENNIWDMELVNVAEPGIGLDIVREASMLYHTVPHYAVSPYAAHVHTSLALIPELHSLAICVEYQNESGTPADIWYTVNAATLFGNVDIDEVEDGTFENQYVQEVLDWLAHLRGEKPGLRIGTGIED